MSYQVLARKWRPQIFSDVVGQEHVLGALIHALDHQRLHHAYLFTGTRGVGKTTLARILARCLNCEEGISSTPCGRCDACIEISEGRFIDLLEVDAASRTRVDDTRELLDNVQYAPTRGRFKIYLIDEVHMLSTHSFNALLKTLEEPPEHVKFLLATTDPQKLPVTVLSRCLQFNLKNLGRAQIAGHLADILDKETIPYEMEALRPLANAADGSMRDALSLTDQAVSHCGGTLREHEVAVMLGTVDHQQVKRFLSCLLNQDGQALMQLCDQISEHAVDYLSLVAQLLDLVHRIAVRQQIPDDQDTDDLEAELIADFARQFSAADLQAYYQMLLLGRRDLHLSPDLRTGFDMLMLRLLAFRPLSSQQAPSGEQKSGSEPGVAQGGPPMAGDPPSKKFETGPAVGASELVSSSESARPSFAAHSPTPHTAEAVESRPTTDEVALAATDEPTPKRLSMAERLASSDALNSAGDVASKVRANPDNSGVSINTSPAENEPVSPVISLDALEPETWAQVVQQLPVTAMIKSLCSHMALLKRDQDRLFFVLEQSNSAGLTNQRTVQLADALSEYFQRPVRVDIQAGQPTTDTPAVIARQKYLARKRAAEQRLLEQPVVKQAIELFGANLVPDSIQLHEDKEP